jgi:copper(I)-binding protein
VYIEEAVKVTRWNRRLLIGAVALLLPALAGCEAGFNAPTLEFHQASNGTTIVQNNIRIDDAFVLASAPAGVSGGQAGTFLTIYATNGDRLVSASAPGAASSVKLTNGPVNLPADTLVDLSGPVPQVVLTGLTSPLTGGETIQMSFTFAVAGTITLPVPVEAHTTYYATYSPPAVPGASPTARPKPTSTVLPTPGASGTASNSVGGATGSSTP